MNLSFTDQVNAHIQKGNMIYESIERGTINATDGAIRILQLVGAIKTDASNVIATEGLEQDKFVKWQEETESLYDRAIFIIK